MTLAPDQIIIELAGEAIELRPSLRVAMRLERRYGGFLKLYDGIQEQSLNVYADVIGEFTTLAFLPAKIGCDGLKAFRQPLLDFLFSITGAEKNSEGSTGPGMSYRAYFERLFTLGTGWLGWTPETVWNATPLEILTALEGRAAMEGRAELLRAIFGGSDKPNPRMSDLQMNLNAANFVDRMERRFNAAPSTLDS